MKLKTTIILFTLLLSVSLVAQDTFVRSAVIPIPDTSAGFGSGFGNIVAGVDFDGDGNLEIYAVNNEWNDTPGEEIPTIYKYEFNGTTWDSVWATKLAFSGQNTWPALEKADLDGDGRMEIVWGPVNSLSDANPNPPRFVVFEYSGTGDVMGVDNGDGTFSPNSVWNANVADKEEMRPIKWLIDDFDGDGTQELAWAARKGNITFAIASVDNIPDNADGSETWTLEFSGNDPKEQFIRTSRLPSPDGGFGNVVAGMDYDGDGLTEMYAVNNDWSDGPNGELVPTIYKYELVNGGMVLRWQTTLPGVSLQNTWPVLLAGDWDGDGKGEIIWCPVNNLGSENPNPPRVVVYETPGDGSDIMGIDNGDGTYNPNAQWNMDLADNTEMRPFNGMLTDVNNDGVLDLFFVERKSQWGWAAISVDNIPDNGDGSETWTMIDHGAEGSNLGYDDCTLIGDKIAVFGSKASMFFLKYNSTTSKLDTVATQTFGQVYPWRTFKTVDVDNDGTDEAIAGIYYSGDANFPTGSVVLFTQDADTLVPHLIGSFDGMTPDHIASLEVGDIDADSLVDFVMGFKLSDIVVRLEYNGTGDITDAASYTLDTLDQGTVGVEGKGQVDALCLTDMDGDGADEIFYGGTPRSIDENTEDMIYGDYGTWTVSGTTWDIAAANGKLYAFRYGGPIFSFCYDAANAEWKYGPIQNVGYGSIFKSASTYDVDGDGSEEIMLADYGGSGDIFLLQEENGALQPHVVANLIAIGGGRLTGGDIGDIDGDGYVDFITGSRADSNPPNSVYRIKYRGGDMLDAANWGTEVIDHDINSVPGGQIDVIRIANMDDDADLEVVYTGIPRGGAAVPIVILDIQKIQAEAIADVRVDADGDGVPDRIGEDVTIKGIVTTNSFSSSSILIGVQDETAGVVIYQGGNDSTSLPIGTLVLVQGAVSQYKGLTEINVSNIIALGQGTVPDPIVLTIEEYTSDYEAYEGSLIKINAITKTEDSVWPDSGNSGSYYFTDGYETFKAYLDRDVDISGNPEPVFPANITGIVAQYSSSNPLDGYQLWPRAYSDIEQDVAAPPSPYFFFTDETKALDGGTLDITDPAADYQFIWHPAIDLNGDALIYQVVVWNVADGTVITQDLSDNNGVDTTETITGQDIIDAISQLSSDSTLTVGMTIRTTAVENPSDGIIPSVDTIRVTLVDHVTSVNDRNLIPKEFFVDQNYPNPFNPTTTIQFGLPSDSKVSLIIYDILGRVVATLIDNQTMAAGVYQQQFDASRLASGTYIYRLQADQKVEVKKMLLLK